MPKTNATQVLRQLLTAILLSFPAVLLVLPAGRRASLYLLLLSALACMACRLRPAGLSFGELLKKYWPINTAMMAMLFAVLAQQLVHWEFSFKAIEKALEFAVFPFLLWTLLLLPIKRLQLLQWALMIGVGLSSITLYKATQGGSVRVDGVISSPLNPFSDLITLMGFMALLSISWNRRSETWMIALKIVTWCVSLYASYISGTRGSWIAIPFFVMIAVSILSTMSPARKALMSLAATIAIAGAMAVLPYTKARMELAYTEVVGYEHSNVDTSIGVRLQIWRTSLNVWRKNPVLGIGVDQFEQELKDRAASQQISPMAGMQLHAHNDFLQALATFGALGAIAILALYVVPGIWFIRLANPLDRQQRVTAGMGLALPLGYFVYGMTDTLFYWSVCSHFYVIILATLGALLIKQREESAAVPTMQTGKN
jgi:O-antigen ligase